MPLPPEFRIADTDGTLRIEWDNRKVAKDDSGGCFLLIVWPVFGLFAVMLTLGLIRVLGERPITQFQTSDYGFFCCATPCFWGIVLFIPYWLSMRTWQEVVEVTREAITHTQIGWFSPKPAIYPISEVTKVVIGWYRSSGQDDTTSQVRIFILWRGRLGEGGSILSQWLADPLQEQLFLTIRDFATRNNIPLAFAEWGTRPDWAQKEGGQPPAPRVNL